MYLSKRNGVYHLYHRNKNGKITTKSTKTILKSEALKFLSRFDAEFSKRKPESIQFKNLIFEFLKNSESIHKWNHTKTLRVTLNQAKNHFGNIAFDSFTAVAILFLIRENN